MDERNPLTYICIGSSFAFSWLFYESYQKKKREIQRIKAIPKFQPNEELLKTVKATPQKRLLYAAVEGMVQPDGQPLASEYVPRCHGVIQKVQVEETWEVWNPVSRAWSRRKTNTTTTSNTVPFHLVCPGASVSKVALKIESPLEAVEPYLERVYHEVKYARDGLVNFLLQELGAERPFCLAKTERILRVGTRLTGFGEVVLEEGRVLKLRPPTNGEPYLLFPTDYRDFLQTHEKTATMWKVLTALFGLAGATLLAWTIYRAYQRYEKKRGRN